MPAIPKRVRVDVLERDLNSCRRCLVHLSVRGYSIHHRQGRRGVDANALANVVLLCGSGTTGCHGWAHAHPEKAYASGWMVRRTGLDDPEGIPLVDITGRLFGLTNDGQVIAWSADTQTLRGQIA